MEDIQQERKEWVDMISLLNNLEIKGQKNISILYTIMAFIEKKIYEIDKKGE